MQLSSQAKLEDFLVRQGIVSPHQLQSAIRFQKQSGKGLAEALVAQGSIDEVQLLEIRSLQSGIPRVNLEDYDLIPSICHKLSELQSRRLQSLVVEETKDRFTVAMVDPTNTAATDEISRILKKPFDVALTLPNDLQKAMVKVYGNNANIDPFANKTNPSALPSRDFSGESGDSPVAQFIKNIIEDATQAEASDIHIEPEENSLQIRLRRDGILFKHSEANRTLCSPLISRLKLMAGLDISEKRLPQDGRFQMNVLGKKIDFRLSTVPVQHGESAAIRLLDQSKQILDLEKTGMPADMLLRFRKLLHGVHGMVLVTGPTGSGKTTTLYGALAELNTPHLKIITAEDPVEYQLAGINQVQMNPKIGLTFSSVLRSFLRQDPDIILLGEMRDHETVEMGLKAAMTGHLVLSTLHTGDVVSTIVRLLNMGAPAYLIAAALRGVIAQRLVKKICQHCKQPYKPDAQQAAWIKSIWGDKLNNVKLYHGRGCPQCHHTGYRGRVAIHEFVEMEAGLIQELQNQNLENFARLVTKQQGYQSLQNRALALAVKGHTSIDQVMRVAVL